MIKGIPRADYVVPILERTELYIREHPEKFEHVKERGQTIFWQNMKKVKGENLP